MWMRVEFCVRVSMCRYYGMLVDVRTSVNMRPCNE